MCKYALEKEVFYLRDRNHIMADVMDSVTSSCFSIICQDWLA